LGEKGKMSYLEKFVIHVQQLDLFWHRISYKRLFAAVNVVFVTCDDRPGDDHIPVNCCETAHENNYFVAKVILVSYRYQVI
jgi:hypothetical protein